MNTAPPRHLIAETRAHGLSGYALMHQRPEFWRDREFDAVRSLCGGRRVPPPWCQPGWPVKFTSTKPSARRTVSDWIVPDYMRYSRLFAD